MSDVLAAVSIFAAGLAVGVLIGRRNEVNVNVENYAPSGTEEAAEEDEDPADESAGGDWWKRGRRPLGEAG